MPKSFPHITQPAKQWGWPTSHTSYAAVFIIIAIASTNFVAGQIGKGYVSGLRDIVYALTPPVLLSFFALREAWLDWKNRNTRF